MAIEKINENEFLFIVNKKDKLKVLFLEDGQIELNILEEEADDEIVLLKFNSIKEFKIFCNSITDIIEYNNEEIK